MMCFLSRINGSFKEKNIEIIVWNVLWIFRSSENRCRYKDFDGNEQDIFKNLKQSGVNYVRVPT